jgi:DNA-binding NtrC family response regulator
LPGRIVLVVEDEPLLRAYAASTLEDAGLEVITCDTADTALAFIRNEPDHVAAVFTDVQMPGDVDGFELARIVAQHWPGIIVLVTSGRACKPQDFPASAKFIGKPWSASDMLNVLGEAVAKHCRRP